MFPEDLCKKKKNFRLLIAFLKPDLRIHDIKFRYIVKLHNTGHNAIPDRHKTH